MGIEQAPRQTVSAVQALRHSLCEDAWPWMGYWDEPFIPITCLHRAQPKIEDGMRHAAVILLVAIGIAVSTASPAAEPLVLEAKIPLGAVSGRIDHFAVDLARQRLFVAELGNNSVGVVDLAAGTV